jgi:hypothetical protein
MLRAGVVHLASPQRNGLTWQTGGHSTVRGTFATQGVLPNTRDIRQPRTIENDWPVFAYAIDFGSVTSTPADAPALFAVGHTRDKIVQYITPGGSGGTITQRAPYWQTGFNSVQQMVAFYLQDWKKAVGVANALDTRVTTEAGAISKDYEGLVTLSIRQAFAALEPTVGRFANGTVNKDDVLVFMKEISSNGVSTSACAKCSRANSFRSRT